VVEFGSYDAAVAVWTCDFAPDDPDLGSLSFSARSVDVCYSLSKIESMIVVSDLLPPSSTTSGAGMPGLLILLLLCDGNIGGRAYCASFELSTPSIFTRDVLGFVFRFPL